MEPVLKGLQEYRVYPGFITGIDLYCHCVKCLGWDKTEKWYLLAALLCRMVKASLVRWQQCSPSLMWSWSVTMDGWQTESCWDILTNYSCWLATGSSSSSNSVAVLDISKTPPVSSEVFGQQCWHDNKLIHCGTTYTRVGPYQVWLGFNYQYQTRPRWSLGSPSFNARAFQIDFLSGPAP